MIFREGTAEMIISMLEVSAPGMVQGFAWSSPRLCLGIGGSRYLSWINKDVSWDFMKFP